MLLLPKTAIKPYCLFLPSAIQTTHSDMESFNSPITKLPYWRNQDELCTLATSGLQNYMCKPNKFSKGEYKAITTISFVIGKLT